MKKNLLAVMLIGASALALASCGDKVDPDSTASVVEHASKLTLAELEAESKKEMEASKDTFKVLGLTSILKKTMTEFAKKYTWIKYDEDDPSKSNAYVKNDYKDYTLLTALDPAEKTYVADFALTQDVRSIADYDRAGILLNFVPSDYKDLGLTEKDTKPLKGVHFNKVFWTNKNFETVTGKKLYNIWQMAGTDADKDHLSKVSFQTPQTEQINMSFLLSVEAPENQDRIKAAYKKYYGKDWASEDYASAGEQWVTEFIKNISRYHSSDGTAMKQTQLESDWNEGYVYYGAYAKMKDAAGKYYTVTGQEEDPILKDLIEADGENKGKINAMKTVKWDWEIEGFNGFMYTMCSQIINHAKHPYTACLYARYLLEPEMYAKMCHNSKTPNKAGEASNQYGYYYPGSALKYKDGDVEKDLYNDNDWTKAKWIECEINEDYSYLSNVKSAQVNAINALVASSSK